MPLQQLAICRSDWLEVKVATYFHEFLEKAELLAQSLLGLLKEISDLAFFVGLLSLSLIVGRVGH